MKTNATRWKKILLAVWGAMTASVLMYVFVACVLATGICPLKPSQAPTIAPIAGILSILLPLGALVAGLSLYRTLVPVAETADFPAGGGEADVAALRKAAILRGTIAMLSVFEVVAVVGLVFLLLGASLGVFLRYAAANVLLNFVGLRRILQDVGQLEQSERRTQLLT